MKHLLIIIIFQLLFLPACKKTTADANATQFLRDRSLQEVKDAVLGNWKIHYSFGGITGNIKTTLSSSFLNVKSNDSVYLTFNGMPTANGIATFERINTNFGFSAVRMNFTSFSGSPYPWIVDRKLGDTLVLVDDYPNGQGYYMTRIP